MLTLDTPTAGNLTIIAIYEHQKKDKHTTIKNALPTQITKIKNNSLPQPYYT